MKRDLYRIPDIKLIDIIDYFASINIEIHTEEILKPTYNTTIRLFEKITEALRGESVSATILKYNSEDGSIENDETMRVVIVYMKICDLLSKVGIYGFTVSCITQPETKKLISTLSVIMNFSIYRDNKRDIYDRMRETVKEREKIREELKERIKFAKNSVEKQKKVIKENEITRRDEEEGLNKLEEILRDYYRELRTLATEVEKIKSERNAMSDKLNECMLLTLNIKQDLVKLDTQIITNPEEMLRNLAEMRNNIKIEKDKITTMKNKGATLVKNASLILKGKEKLMIMHKNTVNIHNTDNEIEKLIDKNNDIENKIEFAKQNIKSLNLKMNHLTRQISHLEAKLYNIQNISEENSKGLSGGLEEIKNKYEKISEDRSNSNIQSMENMDNCRRIEIETFHLQKTHTETVMKVNVLLKDVKTKINSYSNKIKQVLKNNE